MRPARRPRGACALRACLPPRGPVPHNIEHHPTRLHPHLPPPARPLKKKKPRKGSRGSTEMDGDPALPGLGRFSAAPNTETCVPRDKSSLLAARRCSQYSHHLCSGPGAPATCVPRDKSSTPRHPALLPIQPLVCSGPAASATCVPRDKPQGSPARAAPLHTTHSVWRAALRAAGRRVLKEGRGPYPRVLEYHLQHSSRRSAKQSLSSLSL